MFQIWEFNLTSSGPWGFLVGVTQLILTLEQSTAPLQWTMYNVWGTKQASSTALIQLWIIVMEEKEQEWFVVVCLINFTFLNWLLNLIKNHFFYFFIQVLDKDQIQTWNSAQAATAAITCRAIATMMTSAFKIISAETKTAETSGIMLNLQLIVAFQARI